MYIYVFASHIGFHRIALDTNLPNYEPGGREFESLRARHKDNGLDGYRLGRFRLSHHRVTTRIKVGTETPFVGSPNGPGSARPRGSSQTPGPIRTRSRAHRQPTRPTTRSTPAGHRPAFQVQGVGLAPGVDLHPDQTGPGLAPCPWSPVGSRSPGWTGASSHHGGQPPVPRTRAREQLGAEAPPARRAGPGCARRARQRQPRARHGTRLPGDGATRGEPVPPDPGRVPSATPGERGEAPPAVARPSIPDLTFGLGLGRWGSVPCSIAAGRHRLSKAPAGLVSPLVRQSTDSAWKRPPISRTSPKRSPGG